MANLESKIEETLKNPDKTSLEELEKSAKEDIKKIKDETENASFNGAKIFDKNNEISQNKQNNDIISNNSIQDESKLKELGKLEEPAFQDKQQVQDFLKLAQEARQEVESKQIGLAAIDEKLVNRVSSLIEFESNIKPPEMKIQEHGNELAQAAKDSILANPKQATQVQLNVLDEKIILAMFSITRRN
ncbi:MAG: hypothetical protein MZV64_27140 [Ignavibacteriales bacterium]|nr:hypothetical protein [Ignavibacteriales bacterium]